MHHKVLVNCIRIITFQIHFWDIRITCIQRTHLELDEVLSVWCVRGPPASRLCNGLPSIYSCLPVIILHNCLKSVPSDTWCHQEYVDGHISARWLHIFRMDMWLQIYHLYQYSYKGHRHETLPVGDTVQNCWFKLVCTQDYDYDSLAYLMSTGLVSTQPMPPSPLLKSPVSALTTVTTYYYLLSGNCNSPWDLSWVSSPHCTMPETLWSYVFCRGVHVTMEADHLENAGFNVNA